MDFGRIIEIDFLRCFKAIFRNIKWVILSTFAFLFIGVLVAVLYLDTENVYDAKASVYSIAYGSYSDSADGIQAIRAYRDIVKSVRVAERAAVLLGDSSLDKYAIYDMIEVEEGEVNAYGVESESSIINIHAKSTNPEDAIRVANAVASAYAMEVTSITNSDNVQVLDEAYYCEVTYNALKQQIIYTAVIAVAGMLLAIVAIVLREIFSTKIVTVEQGSLYGELDIIGVIPQQSLK
ncbi:MAG: hypothetical protein IJZ82_05215 [Lachnospiraceae bacterium]|nr:hypothetical protein [Lachnospiraceae bacterium]